MLIHKNDATMPCCSPVNIFYLQHSSKISTLLHLHFLLKTVDYVMHICTSLKFRDVAMNQKSRKAGQLTKHGTLNRHADRVNHPFFQTEPFFDPQDLLQVRYEMLRQVQHEGHSVAETVKRFGVSRPTWYHLANAFREGGLVALVPERPGPRQARKINNAILKELLSARRERPEITTAELCSLVHQRFGLVVHRTTVERALRRTPK